MNEIAGFHEISYVSNEEYRKSKRYTESWIKDRTLSGFVEDEIEFPYSIEESFIFSEIDEKIYEIIDENLEKTKYNLVSYYGSSICYRNFIDIYSGYFLDYGGLISLRHTPLNKYKQKTFLPYYVIIKPFKNSFYILHPKNYYLGKYKECIEDESYVYFRTNQKSFISLSEFFQKVRKCKETGDTALTHFRVDVLCKRRLMKDVENEIISNEVKFGKRNILMFYNRHNSLRCVSIEYILTIINLMKENGIVGISSRRFSKETFINFINYLKTTRIKYKIVEG